MNRKCPECNTLLTYKSKSSFYAAIKNNSICKKCSGKKRRGISNYDIWLKKYGKKEADRRNKQFSEKRSKCQSGENNSFFNKTHSIETKQTIANHNKGKKLSKKTKAKISNKTAGKNNPMYGKSYYDIWVTKYGKKEADILLEKKKAKHRKSSAGKNNPMYNKPSPNGSGNGYKGRYKGLFFRSLRELSFMIKCDEFGIIYKPAENISIKYKFKNKDRTYRPDFLIKNCLIEIKPAKIQKSQIALLKAEAAKNYCISRNLRYKVVDPTIDAGAILQNLKNQNIEFISNYLERFNAYYEKHCKTKK